MLLVNFTVVEVPFDLATRFRSLINCDQCWFVEVKVVSLVGISSNCDWSWVPDFGRPVTWLRSWFRYLPRLDRVKLGDLTVTVIGWLTENPYSSLGLVLPNQSKNPPFRILCHWLMDKKFDWKSEKSWRNFSEKLANMKTGLWALVKSWPRLAMHDRGFFSWKDVPFPTRFILLVTLVFPSSQNLVRWLSIRLSVCLAEA